MAQQTTTLMAFPGGAFDAYGPETGWPIPTHRRGETKPVNACQQVCKRLHCAIAGGPLYTYTTDITFQTGETQ